MHYALTAHNDIILVYTSKINRHISCGGPVKPARVCQLLGKSDQLLCAIASFQSQLANAFGNEAIILCGARTAGCPRSILL